jgi:hypothetical protein
MSLIQEKSFPLLLQTRRLDRAKVPDHFDRLLTTSGFRNMTRLTQSSPETKNQDNLTQAPRI